MVKINEPGYVYILTNPSFREDWVKIGKSARDLSIYALKSWIIQRFRFHLRFSPPLRLLNIMRLKSMFTRQLTG